MEISLIERGMVFYLDDLIREDSRHPYIVISDGDNVNIGYVQCMAITSMIDKTVTYEVPIKLKEEISYILPYNIHSFNRKDFNIKNCAGIIKDGEMNKAEFMKMLMDIYISSMGGDYSSIKEKYNNYCTQFKANNIGVKEYRESKEITKSKVFHAPSSLRRDESVGRPLTESVGKVLNKSIEVKKDEAKDHESITVNRSYSPHIPLEIYKEYESLCSVDRYIAKWSDEDINKFMKLFKSYNWKDFSDITNLRWKSEAGITSAFKNVEKEARKRGLTIVSKYDKYSSGEIQHMLNRFEKHKNHASKLPGLYQLFSVTNKNDLIREAYNYKKELNRRKREIPI